MNEINEGKTDNMTNDDNTPRGPRLNGCGWALLVVLGPLALAFALAILYILFMLGSRIGGL
jgi:hypothetical protein